MKQNIFITGMIKKGFLLAIVLGTLVVNAIAQKGTITGHVKDAATGEPLIGTTIFLDGTTIGTITDFDGNYIIPNVPAGTYSVKCSFISYDTQQKDGITVTEGNNQVINFELSEATVSLGEINVVAKVNRESENILLLDQKKATVMEEKIGAMELSRKGASDVAAGVKKVTGVSMMGSKQLFVRGLGDRFNSAQLNGLPLPSPDPMKKVVKLDLFPSDIVKTLGVNKVYSARNYADYTGALINIVTKDYPKEPFLSISVGGKYNSNSTFEDFKRIDAEGNTFLGFDVKDRSDLTPSKYKEVNRLMKIGSDFNIPSFGFSEDAALPNMEFAIKGGKIFEFNDVRKLGVLASISLENEYEFLPDVYSIRTNKQGNVSSDFVSQEYSYNSLFSSLLNLSYTHNDKHSFKYNLVFLNNGEDQFKEKKGLVPDWGESDTALVRNAEYISYELLSNQLQGKHKLNDKWDLNWTGSYASVKYDVPDRREIVFQQDGNYQWKFFTLNDGNDTKRVITDQDAFELNAKIDLVYQLNDEKGELIVGGATRYKDMAYNTYFYGYDFNNSIINDLVVKVDDPNSYLTDQAVDKIWAYSTDDMGYNGKQTIHSAFIDLVYNVKENLTFNVGVRTELSEMIIEENTNKLNGNESEHKFDNFDLFPAFNLKYTVNDKSNLRMGLSRTVTRPSFYEKSPARLIPEAGEPLTMGNVGTKDKLASDGSYLENSYSNNFDIKFEVFPSSGELISIGGYVKKIYEPIERIQRLMGGNDFTYSYRNFTEDALAAGVEFEIKKKFGNLYTGLNAAYIYTNIDVPEEANENKSSRELQGASPYLINADLGYKFVFSEDHQSNIYAGLIYNVFGKRLYAVGINQGDQYETPFHSLDFILKNKINNKLSVNLSVKNMLNSEVRLYQEVYEDYNTPDKVTQDATIKKYKKGVNVNVGVSYKF